MSPTHKSPPPVISRGASTFSLQYRTLPPDARAMDAPHAADRARAPARLAPGAGITNSRPFQGSIPHPTQTGSRCPAKRVASFVTCDQKPNSVETAFRCIVGSPVGIQCRLDSRVPHQCPKSLKKRVRRREVYVTPHPQAGSPTDTYNPAHRVRDLRPACRRCVRILTRRKIATCRRSRRAPVQSSHG